MPGIRWIRRREIKALSICSQIIGGYDLWSPAYVIVCKISPCYLAYTSIDTITIYFLDIGVVFNRRVMLKKYITVVWWRVLDGRIRRSVCQAVREQMDWSGVEVCWGASNLALLGCTAALLVPWDGFFICALLVEEEEGPLSERDLFFVSAVAFFTTGTGSWDLHVRDEARESWELWVQELELAVLGACLNTGIGTCAFFNRRVGWDRKALTVVWDAMLEYCWPTNQFITLLSTVTVRCVPTRPVSELQELTLIHWTLTLKLVGEV